MDVEPLMIKMILRYLMVLGFVGVLSVGLYWLVENNAAGMGLLRDESFGVRPSFEQGSAALERDLGDDFSAVGEFRQRGTIGGGHHTESKLVSGVTGIFSNFLVIGLITLVVFGLQKGKGFLSHLNRRRQLKLAIELT
jgi:hypothetical protein